MQRFPFIDLFKSLVHISGDVFEYRHDQFNCIYSFGTMHRRAAARWHGWDGKLYIKLHCSWGWAKTSPETCIADLKRSINGNPCILLVSYAVVLTTTRFDLYIGHHQVAHYIIIKQTIQYTILLYFSNEIYNNCIYNNTHIQQLHLKSLQ
jgi:hypothetical protein